jgi:hypothetical protein
MSVKLFFISFVFALLLPANLKAEPVALDSLSSFDEPINMTVVEKGKKKKNVVEINPKFFTGIGIDIATVALIILCVYYPNYRKMDTIFTFILFNIVIFLLTFVLNKVKLSMGAAFGLFAVFSMLRYRTAGIGMKDMTYLFIFIAVGLISAIQMEVYNLAIICGIIFITTLLLDSKLIIKRESTKTILFEDIELTRPENTEKLKDELIARTGLKIHRYEIRKYNYMKDVASITVYYYE